MVIELSHWGAFTQLDVIDFLGEHMNIKIKAMASG